MSTVRIAATVVFGLRVAYGAALLAAPHRITKRWLGPARETDAAKVALRALGAREGAGQRRGAPAVGRGGAMRPWLPPSVAAGLRDIAATPASPAGLPGGPAPAPAAV